MTLFLNAGKPVVARRFRARRAKLRRGSGGLVAALCSAALAMGAPSLAADRGMAQASLSSPPLPVGRLSLDEVTPAPPREHTPTYVHRPFERLQPGEWRVVGPPFSDHEEGVMGRSVDGGAVLIVTWQPHTARSDGQLAFDLRVRRPGPQPPLPVRGVGEGQAFVDGNGPWKLFTVEPETPAFVYSLTASVEWDGLPNGVRAFEPDECNPGVKGCVRRPLECGRRTLTLKSERFGPYTFDLRANPLKTLFRYMGDHACRDTGARRIRGQRRR